MTDGEKMVWAAVFAEACAHGGYERASLDAYEAVLTLRSVAVTSKPDSGGWLRMLNEMLQQREAPQGE